MRLIALLFSLSVFGVTAQAQQLQVADILNSNLGKVAGLVKADSSSCNLEIDNNVVTGKIVVSPGIYAYAGFYLFPDDLWDLNETNNTLTHYEDSKKVNSEIFVYDHISHKILSYTFVHKGVVGNVCNLKN